MKSNKCLIQGTIVYFGLYISSIYPSPSQSLNNVLEDTSYIICIDGGGSKTELQIVDTLGKKVNLAKAGNFCQMIRVGTSNINTIGNHGFEIVIKDLFDRTSAKQHQRSLQIEQTAILHLQNLSLLSILLRFLRFSAYSSYAHIVKMHMQKRR